MTRYNARSLCPRGSIGRSEIRAFTAIPGRTMTTSAPARVKLLALLDVGGVGVRILVYVGKIGQEYVLKQK